jgi:hypothetical protein
MANISIHNLRERLKVANYRFPEHNFQLLYNMFNPEATYIVDLRLPASQNVISAEMVQLLVGDISYWFFEVYSVGFVAADEYSVEPGYYLAICLYL